MRNDCTHRCWDMSQKIFSTEFHDTTVEVLYHVKPYARGISLYISLTEAFYVVGSSILWEVWLQCCWPPAANPSFKMRFYWIDGLPSGNQTWCAGKCTVEVEIGNFPVKTSIQFGEFPASHVADYQRVCTSRFSWCGWPGWLGRNFWDQWIHTQMKEGITRS